ncbi:site-specific DNA-methyltransferase [Heliobacterium undosum]|uniref:Site-specific DNA-methyltransferase n=1 Tax=Heliomicrobium undosum TaxID=121734 RepID=A0A845L723_9FIRM|nr:site-specific DNA-methyltransferase [Heliomicrobium undosum]MZP30460.1 site-specific DNA-methyltransferase [Heliomicrobium undosum]
MSKAYQKLKRILSQMLQLDRADLDFGIYRIMNVKRAEVEKFFNNDLLPQIKQALSKYTANDEGQRLLVEKSAVQTQAVVGGAIGLAARKQAIDGDAFEQEVYAHLADFFSRYYDKGDFIAQRRYKEGVYALPYQGEEVKLYWANADQYYVKSAEDLSHYTFKVPSGKKVHFRITGADVERDNNKEAKGKERRFALCSEAPLQEAGGDLIIRFAYFPNSKKQQELNEATLSTLRALLAEAPWQGKWDKLFQPAPSESASQGLAASASDRPSERALLEKHLNIFTAKNSFDYFIHKDLGGFLRQELDFYIKNEIMRLDDLNTEGELPLETTLAKIRVVKDVGYKIIQFLAQIEDFQKRVWLKKKFVLETHYCVTVDRLPDELLEEVINNTKQIGEWKKLFVIDELEGYAEPVTFAFLRANPYLVVDTALFKEDFAQRLVASFDSFDDRLDGLLVHGDNFQALQLLQAKYREQVKCVYIDPPYNAKSSEILYKNSYKHSSWLSMMFDRLQLGKNYLREDGVQVIAIDEVEQEVLGQIISQVFPDYRKVCVPIVHNPRGQQGKNVSYVHEFAYFIYPSDEQKYLADVKRGEINSRTLRDSGTESDRTDARTCFYPFIVKNEKIVAIGDVPDDAFHPAGANVCRADGTIEIWPIDESGNEKKWRYARNSVERILDKLEIKKGRSAWQVIFHKDTGVMRSLWADAKYDASEYGTKLLQGLFGEEATALFSYPKSIHTVQDTLAVAFHDDRSGMVLDYFAGSGTTGHGVINLNREDQGARKYILIEMGEYFHTVTKPRLQKAIYSKDWKNGKPLSRQGASHMFKYIRLESYEDALNNLQIRPQTAVQQSLLDGNEEFRESYLLEYMLDVETQGSPSLLNIDGFANPFAYKLKIHRDGEFQFVHVDLVETFHYVLGLKVNRQKAREGYCLDQAEYLFQAIEGETPDGHRVLVIWRTLTGDMARDNAALDAYFVDNYGNGAAAFDRIYVNGDNNLALHRPGDHAWRVFSIEEAFLKGMFDDQSY